MCVRVRFGSESLERSAPQTRKRAARARRADGNSKIYRKFFRLFDFVGTRCREGNAMGAEQSTEGAAPDTQRAIEGGAHKYAQKSADAAKLLPKTVKDLDDDQLGELVASVLDFYTKHYGSIPTNPELIKMAQKALSELNVQGDLMEREKDIAKIVDVLLEEDAA